MYSQEYQSAALSTCMPSCRNIAYPTFAIIEEMGEFIEKLRHVISIDPDSPLHHTATILLEQQDGIGKGARFVSKAVRHETAAPPIAIDITKLTPDAIEGLKSELGDILWNITLLSQQLGFPLDDVQKYNIQKLAKRKAANTIDANGDTDRTPIE